MSKAGFKKLEWIQKRPTKLVIELRAMDYEERRVLVLITLEIRRKRGDIIQILKIFKGIRLSGGYSKCVKDLVKQTR